MQATDNDAAIGALPSVGASLRGTDASVECDSKSAALYGLGDGTEPSADPRPSLGRAGPPAVARSLEPSSMTRASAIDGHAAHAGDSDNGQR